MIWKLRRYRSSFDLAPRPSTLRRVISVVGWALWLVVFLLIVDSFYLVLTWPDWARLSSGPVPKSQFIRSYELRRNQDRALPSLRWQPVALGRIPTSVQRAVILAEDSRFYQHSGFDLIAFKEAMDYNVAQRRFALGASTISQQTVKNLFLNPSRNPLRKWHELILTWGMEHNLAKDRVLEIYLNIAEFGPGIYGVEAASRAYWSKSVSALTLTEAAALAATLPSPKKHNPATQTARFTKRVDKIMRFLERFGLESTS